MDARTGKFFLLGLLVLAVSAACSSHKADSKTSAAIESGSLQIDVFSARGFLGGSDYERYFLTDDLLWRECGHVTSSKPKTRPSKPLEGDQVFASDPSLEIQQRRLESVESKLRKELKTKASQLINALEASDTRAPLPGSFFSLSDPGLIEMHVVLGEKEQRLITSVDAVAERESYALERAHDLFACLRGIGPVICDAQTFFGIGRK